ncbi:MAG: sulfotransferase, partial [Cyanobacteria bacterium P01_C01_bin.69]
AEFIYTKYPATDKDIAILRRMHIYESVTFDRGKFIDAYHRYHADVRRYFKDRPNDLLEMNIVEGEGWEKLCPFLEMPVPEAAFPHRNKRTDHYPTPQVESMPLQRDPSELVLS